MSAPRSSPRHPSRQGLERRRATRFVACVHLGDLWASTTGWGPRVQALTRAMLLACSSPPRPLVLTKARSADEALPAPRSHCGRRPFNCSAVLGPRRPAPRVPPFGFLAADARRSRHYAARALPKPTCTSLRRSSELAVQVPSDAVMAPVRLRRAVRLAYLHGLT